MMKNIKNTSLNLKKMKMMKKVLGLTLKFIEVSKGKPHGVIMKTQRGKQKNVLKKLNVVHSM